MEIEFISLNNNKKLAEELYAKIDKDFKYFLGYENGLNSFIEEVTEPDEKHKHWCIFIDNKLAGIIYIYGYSEKYKKCALGYGLIPEYRGRNLTPIIINKFCNYIEEDLGIIRIQADIEVINEHCLNCIANCIKDIGFEYESTAKNYWGKGCTCKIFSRCK